MTIDGVVTRNEERTLLSKYPYGKELDELYSIFINERIESLRIKIKDYAGICI